MASPPPPPSMPYNSLLHWHHHLITDHSIFACLLLSYTPYCRFNCAVWQWKGFRDQASRRMPCPPPTSMPYNSFIHWQHHLITKRSLCLSFAVLCGRFNCAVWQWTKWDQVSRRMPMPRPPSAPYNSFLQWQQTLITERGIFARLLLFCAVYLTVSCVKGPGDKW